ncbi:MAG: DUF502 domain-containing protein [Saprospiraceae bacterium]|nr:DUF502 domain-containing protein [Saprospiraceae bacterium]
MEEEKTKFSTRMLKYFVQGLLFLAPISITVLALYYSFVFLDDILKDFIPKNIPGLGLVLVLVLITTIGFLGSLFASPLFTYIEKLLTKTPLIKIIYTSVKDLLDAFVGGKRKFTEAVMVKISKDPEMHRLGFITSRDLERFGVGEDKVAVYLPYSYSVMGGVFIVSIENVTPIDVSSTEMMKFIVSGGVTES